MSPVSTLVLQVFFLYFRDALITAGINCCTSFIAGFVVFSVLGYMSFKQDKNIDQVAEHGKFTLALLTENSF